ncbi:Inositol-pentakisphosphate 2-kinase [Savitreella phatthalungensis]
MLQSQHRDSRFVGQRLDSNETHASRMPLLRDDRGRALLEFKPKWLAQSPDAPADAIVCRTCAVRRMRSPSSASGFCPLDLISLRRSDVDRAVQALSAERSWRLSVDSQSALAKLLYQNPLLMHLKKLQQEARDQALAMTLRDCSAYVDLEKGCIILGDLDRKHSDKRSQWAATEHELREGAFYYGQPCPMLLGS